MEKYSLDFVERVESKFVEMVNNFSILGDLLATVEVESILSSTRQKTLDCILTCSFIRYTDRNERDESANSRPSRDARKAKPADIVGFQ